MVAARFREKAGRGHDRPVDISDLTIDHLISTSQLSALGLTAPDIRALCHAGSLRRVCRGWYAVAPDPAKPPWEGETSWDSERQWHLLRTRALLRVFDGRAAASHHSAVLLHGGRTLDANLDAVHLERTVDDHSRHRLGAVIHPSGANTYRPLTSGVEFAGGYLAVPPAVAAVQVGLVSGATPLRRGLASRVAAESLLWAKATTVAELHSAVEAHAGVPGILSVRHVLTGLSSLSESPGETILTFQMARLGSRFRQQVPIPGTPYVVDALLDDEATIVEFDGRDKYFMPRSRDGVVDPRAALNAEKDRHDELVRRGYGVARVRWWMLWDLKALAAEIEGARVRSRRFGPRAS